MSSELKTSTPEFFKKPNQFNVEAKSTLNRYCQSVGTVPHYSLLIHSNVYAQVDTTKYKCVCEVQVDDDRLRVVSAEFPRQKEAQADAAAVFLRTYVERPLSHLGLVVAPSCSGKSYIISRNVQLTDGDDVLKEWYDKLPPQWWINPKFDINYETPLKSLEEAPGYVLTGELDDVLLRACQCVLVPKGEEFRVNIALRKEVNAMRKRAGQREQGVPTRYIIDDLSERATKLGKPIVHTFSELADVLGITLVKPPRLVISNEPFDSYGLKSITVDSWLKRRMRPVVAAVIGHITETHQLVPYLKGAVPWYQSVDTLKEVLALRLDEKDQPQ